MVHTVEHGRWGSPCSSLIVECGGWGSPCVQPHCGAQEIGESTSLASLSFLFPFHVHTARSPVFSHLSSSLQGLWTIRAYKAEERCQELFDAHQDLHSGLYIDGGAFKSW